jgi:hypothetical protein
MADATKVKNEIRTVMIGTRGLMSGHGLSGGGCSGLLAGLEGPNPRKNNHKPTTRKTSEQITMFA